MVNYKKDRIDLGYLPSDGETLKSFCERLRHVAIQQRHSFAPSHENWYTHYGPHSCWICNLLDMTDYMIATVEDVWKNDKKHIWRCEKPVGTADPMAFQFKPKKIV